MLTVMSVQSELPNSGEAGPPAHPQSVCPVRDAGTADMVLTDLPANHVASSEGVVEGPIQMKNGLQCPADTQQKLNKRRYSMNVGFKHPGLGKRRRRANSECDPVLPTKFLLGGNIFDPLNLNSLLDEEVNRALNAQTPKSSPLPAKNRDPVEILIPKDITDPLNLNGSGGDVAAGVLASPLKSRRRHRNRHHGAVTVGAGGQSDHSDNEKSKISEGAVSGSSVSPVNVCAEGAVLPGLQAVKESPRPYELNTSINCRDEVVPPILPRRRSHPSSSSSVPQTQSRPAASACAAQPSKHKKRRRTNSRSDRLSVTPTPPTKQVIAEKARGQAFHTPVASGTFPSDVQKIQQNRRRPQHKFQYGNYSRCYSYHAPEFSADPRLAVLKFEWFHGKKVLDVGCNTGHVTIAVAQHWSPEHILGLDIDGTLIHAARQNLRHFLSEPCCRKKSDVGDGSEVKSGGGLQLTSLMKLQLERDQALPRFPLSFTRCRGPIAAPPVMPLVPGLFPSNVSFLQGNYVPDSDVAVMSQRAEYDVILCLSLTKWVHLNFGDAGLQRLFHRIYRHLLPGGLLILEPQPWISYARRKTLTEVTRRNYSCIRLKPDHFSSYLTSDVGFSSYELLESRSDSRSKGFQRPMYVFHKGSLSDRK